MTIVETPETIDTSGMDIDEQRRYAAGQEQINDKIEKIRTNAVTGISFANPISSEHLTKSNLRDLAAALAENTTLTSVHFNNNPFDDECVEILAAAFGKHPAVKILYFADNGFGDDGATSLATHLAGHRTLQKLVINGTAPMTGKGFTELAKLLEANPELCGMAFGADGTEIINRAEAGLVDMSESAVKANSPNLMTLWPVRGEAKALVARNQEIAKALLEQLGAPLEELPCITQLGGYMRLPALSYYASDEGSATQRAQVAAFKEQLEALPDPALDGELNWETLTAPDASGTAPLDNPKFAQKFGEIATELETRGTPITAEQLLQPNRDGDPYLAIALIADPKRDWIGLLAEQECALTPAELLTAEGKPNGLLQTLVTQSPEKLFTIDNWETQPVADFRKVVGALSDEDKNKVTNRHTLDSSISRQQRTMQIG